MERSHTEIRMGGIIVEASTNGDAGSLHVYTDAVPQVLMLSLNRYHAGYYSLGAYGLEYLETETPAAIEHALTTTHTYDKLDCPLDRGITIKMWVAAKHEIRRWLLAYA